MLMLNYLIRREAEREGNWTAIKNESHLLEHKSFQWMLLVDALKTSLKHFIREQNTDLNGLCLYKQHLIKKASCFS